MVGEILKFVASNEIPFPDKKLHSSVSEYYNSWRDFFKMLKMWEDGSWVSSTSLQPSSPLQLEPIEMLYVADISHNSSSEKFNTLIHTSIVYFCFSNTKCMYLLHMIFLNRSTY